METAGDSSTDSSDSAGDSGDTARDTDTGEAARDTVTLDLAPELGAKLVGEEAGDSYYHDTVVAAAGDVNADGFPDLLIGQPSHYGGEAAHGAAYVVYAPATGTVDLSVADARLLGSPRANWGTAGASVAFAGDVDADGYDDVLVGNPTYNGTGDDEGAAFLVRGPIAGDVSLADADALLQGDRHVESHCETWSATGTSVASAGDVNGDGASDVIVGAPYDGCGPGAAFVVFGPMGGTIQLGWESDVAIRGLESDYSLGYVVGSLGDADGDGLDDVLVSWPDGASSVLVYLGLPAAELTPSDADAWFTAGADLNAGAAPAAAGDTDGDGHVDIAIDAFGNEEGGDYAGAVRLFVGPFAGERDVDAPDAWMLGDHRDANAGRSASAGDADGDGRSNLLLGAPDRLGGPGTAYLVLGPVSGTMSLADADVVLNGEGDDGAGSSVAGPGDVDGDGLDDLFIAGFGDDDGGKDAGAAWLVYAASIW